MEICFFEISDVVCYVYSSELGSVEVNILHTQTTLVPKMLNIWEWNFSTLLSEPTVWYSVRTIGDIKRLLFQRTACPVTQTSAEKWVSKTQSPSYPSRNALFQRYSFYLSHIYSLCKPCKPTAPCVCAFCLHFRFAVWACMQSLAVTCVI